jgi:hopene-associated glycosyltransferase HpnB
MPASSVLFVLACVSLLIWIGLLVFRGRFWWADQRLDGGDGADDQLANTAGMFGDVGDIGDGIDVQSTWPTVYAVVPARNEADVLPQSLRSLLSQNYPGQLQVILVDDQSTDGTAKVACQTADQLGKAAQLQILNAASLPVGWSGKLWALEQGVQAANQHQPDYLLLTDADIFHDSENLRCLVRKAETGGLSLVSLMVLLRCESIWEKFLIPAFVFFFQKLYPFPLVNDPRRKLAAAAGGCSLIRTQVLNTAGGIAQVRQALIDDCALAALIKRPSLDPNQQQRIWLGLTETTRSLRPYPSLKSIWDMVARTAFTQLYYSNWLLAGTLLGMALVYLVAPVATVWGILTANLSLAGVGSLVWLLMSLAYWPTVRLYKISPLWAFTLPAIALLYNLMTLDSAWRHWRGQGGAWKGRVYEIPRSS